MLTKYNFKEVIESTFKGLEKEIAEQLYVNEYCQLSMSSYGQTWISGYTNDLPHNYDEIIEDGTTYFVSLEEIAEILGVSC